MGHDQISRRRDITLGYVAGQASLTGFADQRRTQLHYILAAKNVGEGMLDSFDPHLQSGRESGFCVTGQTIDVRVSRGLPGIIIWFYFMTGIAKKGLGGDVTDHPEKQSDQ
jgi:hypothetical protein